MFKENHISYQIGGIASGDCFVTNSTMRDDIYERTGCIAVDMESASISHTASKNNIPFLIIRSISDFANGIEEQEEKAAEMGLAVVVAVSDASGRPIAVHCMDGAYHGSFDVAVNKTYTSTAFQMSTAKLSRLCQPGQDLYGLQFSNNGKVMILGGGEPLMVGKTMIGALGVSGGSAQEDSDLAAYGASALKEVIKCL